MHHGILTSIILFDSVGQISDPESNSHSQLHHHPDRKHHQHKPVLSDLLVRQKTSVRKIEEDSSNTILSDGLGFHLLLVFGFHD